MQQKFNPGEEAQLRQTIEMFEVITQSQPLDYQSLEILKEAYLKLGMEKEVVLTSKRIANAYVQMGQLSSAIMEYETILQRNPEDADALTAMKQLESKAGDLNKDAAPEADSKKPAKTAPIGEGDDGKAVMQKLFVEGKMITAPDFDMHWPKPNFSQAPAKPVEPFIHIVAEKGIIPIDKSLKMVSDRARLPFIGLERYDLDIELTRSFPRETCLRWCLVPFDRMSKSVLVATTNPFNKQAAAEVERATQSRIIWYLAPPGDLLKILGKAFK